MLRLSGQPKLRRFDGKNHQMQSILLAGECDYDLAESNEDDDDEMQGYTPPRAASRSSDDEDDSHNSNGD